ncbi:MAG: hypothetical protein LRY46_02100 [Candidatus Pacebacteria bacterium]|nr:hypothetical protein [Candidatus Paceibacterota bacterium]
MTSLYVLREIEDMPFQFENINTIEVSLNGSLWNWCDYDNAGPDEGPCASGPRYWVTERS